MSIFRYIVESARNQRTRDDDSLCGALLLCILECCARLLEDILQYFNQWAYVFVGYVSKALAQKLSLSLILEIPLT